MKKIKIKPKVDPSLPIGGHSRVPGWAPEQAAIIWIVNIDGEQVERATSDLLPNDLIMGVQLDPVILASYEEAHGPNFYLIKSANGGHWLNPKAWTEKFGTNGLELVAMRNIKEIR